MNKIFHQFLFVRISFKAAFVFLFALFLLGNSVAAACTITYTYDALGRVVKVVYYDGSQVVYAYDKAGNRTAVIKTH